MQRAHQRRNLARAEQVFKSMKSYKFQQSMMKFCPATDEIDRLAHHSPVWCTHKENCLCLKFDESENLNYFEHKMTSRIFRLKMPFWTPSDPPPPLLQYI